MKVGAYAVFSFALIAILCILASQHQTLPHRPVDPLTNWGQGSNPGKDACPPGTIRIYSQDFFLECYR